MDGISLENLLSLQQQLGSGSLTSSSPATGGLFAALLAEEMDGSSDLTDTTSSAELKKEMLLCMCMSMISGSSESSGFLSILPQILGQTQETNSSTGSAIVDSAMTRIGDPYSKTYRGTGDYVDCSSLAQWAYKQQGISIPGTAAAQAKYCSENGYTISKEELQPGDLIFWENTASDSNRWHDIHHVAIYAGNGKIVEAKTSTGVVMDDIWEGGSWNIVMYARPQANSSSWSSR